MGLQAAPEMIQMHGGPSRDAAAQQMVSQIGERLLAGLDKQLVKEGHTNPYRKDFRFTLLADPKTVNAFALPGGQVFITAALFRDLETEGQLAGVLGHEVGHVIERHGNKQMAKSQLLQGLAAAGGVAGGDANSARMAQAVAQMVQMKYGRGDELEADKWGVRLTYLAWLRSTGDDRRDESARTRQRRGSARVLEHAPQTGQSRRLHRTSDRGRIPARRPQRTGEVKDVTILSGGQAGADLARPSTSPSNTASPHGGWCPRGRRAEDGPIDERYQLTETPSHRYNQRTEWNVRDSDATVVFSIQPEVTGGTALTLAFARKLGKPCLHLASESVSATGQDPAEELSAFLAELHVRRLEHRRPPGVARTACRRVRSRCAGRCARPQRYHGVI